MIPHAFTEDQFVEQPAVGLFAELGWKTTPLCEQKSFAIFEHVYESYPERDAGVYAMEA